MSTRPGDTPYPVDPVFPHAALAGADWADAFEVRIFFRPRDAEEAARRVLGPMPGWAKWLLALRNRLGALVGLKPAAAGQSGGAASMIGPFPVVEARPDEVVLGFDDWHLNFRIVITLAHDQEGAQRLRATTLVKRHNIAGRLYLAAVLPFHKVIVRSTLKGASAPAAR